MSVDLIIKLHLMVEDVIIIRIVMVTICSGGAGGFGVLKLVTFADHFDKFAAAEFEVNILVVAEN
jgi:hypothetical protein